MSSHDDAAKGHNPERMARNIQLGFEPPVIGNGGSNQELKAALQKERRVRKVAVRDKATLEVEIESLSQTLFEEASKMVATERIRQAETEAKLRKERLEKEALRSALGRERANAAAQREWAE
ncbi:hypothetical protein C8J57DRAFT_1727785 [Mycena rebaudengoi]|nr:hypothetical protein C8J57DRAFT_1727785 [Mycena rebaudengoi]